MLVIIMTTIANCEECGKPESVVTLQHNSEYFGFWICKDCARKVAAKDEKPVFKTGYEKKKAD